ncbi:unnamed protein product [Macrosiphum euphorbiae]|uniref:Uncharacterized protein n=1 Tax=Macrosiphum euphorbiae TaxID=13131 RepID=A0AAV0Y165_9HEMI|nr:unnamed protein product [Macrosiphum euphorbiae]
MCGYATNHINPCNGQKTTTVKGSNMHLFIEILNWQGENVNEYSTEALPQLEIQLKNIPEVLQYSGKSFELRGVCSYRRGLSRLRSSIGHYFALCKRGPHNWEIYDDLLKKPKSVKETTKVNCEILIYTI